MQGTQEQTEPEKPDGGTSATGGAPPATRRVLGRRGVWVALGATALVVATGLSAAGVSIAGATTTAGAVGSGQTGSSVHPRAGGPAFAGPPQPMGKVTAVYILIYTLLGRVFGPLLVAQISDHFYSGPQALGFGLGTLAVFAMAGALIAIVWLHRRALHEPGPAIVPSI